MPFIFRFYVDYYGVNSAQTNQIMTIACIIFKLQPEQFNKSVKRMNVNECICLSNKAQLLNYSSIYLPENLFNENVGNRKI